MNGLNVDLYSLSTIFRKRKTYRCYVKINHPSWPTTVIYSNSVYDKSSSWAEDELCVLHDTPKEFNRELIVG